MEKEPKKEGKVVVTAKYNGKTAKESSHSTESVKRKMESGQEKTYCYNDVEKQRI